MNPILLIFLTIIALFVLLIVVKKITKWKFCVICASVCVTWLGLLILYWLGKFNYPILIAVLMGQSVVGFYYLLEKKVKEDLLVFRLPFLLTGTFVVFALLGFTDALGAPLILFGVLWLLFFAIYIYRSNKHVKGVVKKLIECCKNW